MNQRTTKTQPATPAVAIARTKAACAYLSVSRSTLGRLVEGGKLRRLQIGPKAVGFLYSDLDAYINSIAAQ
jgi:excisionase family DNA binding protein